MDQAAATWAGGERRSNVEEEVQPAGAGRWLWIRYRAMRARRFARRAHGDRWADGISPWAFWGLHR
ncbi:hypothetical protein ACRAWB_14025 [Leifsonia poae]|uniref:hypothetical protein n=1 Tax=Leifsonia poae TaxID=110933 RepID=UPI003D681E50